MPETPLVGWESFYVILGSSAAVSPLARILGPMGRHGHFFAAPLSEEDKRLILSTNAQHCYARR